MRGSSILLPLVPILLVSACSLDPSGAVPVGGGGESASSTSSSSSSSSSSTGSSSTSSGVGGMGGTGGVAGMGGTGGAGGSVGNGGGNQGGSGGGGPTCPTTSTPMILVDGPNGPYCIDATEVTSAQYASWLGTNPAPSGEDSRCNWKANYIPRSGQEQCQPKHYDPVNFPNLPVSCVDWCDARAFCKGVGKRLCGGAGGAEISYAKYNDITQSEWTYACSAGGTKVFPYGDTFGPKVCNGDEYDGMNNDGQGEPVDVGSASMCTGGFSGLVDMSGNVWEWENSCEADGDNDPRNDGCRNRGGSFWDDQQSNVFECAGPTYTGHKRNSFNKNIGIRCCADPI